MRLFGIYLILGCMIILTSNLIATWHTYGDPNNYGPHAYHPEEHGEDGVPYFSEL